MTTCPQAKTSSQAACHLLVIQGPTKYNTSSGCISYGRAEGAPDFLADLHYQRLSPSLLSASDLHKYML